MDNRIGSLLIFVIVLNQGVSIVQPILPLDLLLPKNDDNSVNLDDSIAQVQDSGSKDSEVIGVKGDFLLENSAVEEGKRHSALVKRTILYPGNDLEFGGGNAPFCYDRYVTGNCRYRTDPEYCYQYEWTAYAIIQSLGGKIQSDPPGLFLEPGNQERVRVWVKTSCCTPYIRILAIDPYNRDINACIVDVRELQGLHPAEIAGIVIGVLFLLIIIIVIVVLLIKKRKREVVTAEVTQTVGKRNRDSTGGR